MSPADLDAITGRILRAFDATRTVGGAGYQTSYVARGTDFTTNFFAEGVKSPEQLEDDFINLFVWIWSLKDHLKEQFKNAGLPGQLVEAEVNACLALAYVSDIANRAKHGVLRESRSGAFAELVDVGYTVPQESIEQIVVAGPKVTARVGNQQHVEIRAFVVTKEGTRMNALDVLSEAMQCWEYRVLAHLPG